VESHVQIARYPVTRARAFEAYCQAIVMTDCVMVEAAYCP